jgi:endoglucanase Acf2
MGESIIWLALLEWVIKLIAGAGALLAVLVAVFNYRAQTRLKQAEWLKSLFEKFFENSTYKEVRVWLDYGHLHARLTAEEMALRELNEEKFTDFLNFFEFIGVLYWRKHLTVEQVYDVFGYYLVKIKGDADCREWIGQYSFEKLKLLLDQVK